MRKITVEPLWGATIDSIIDHPEDMAIRERCDVETSFNGRPIIVKFEVISNGGSMEQRRAIYKELGIPFPEEAKKMGEPGVANRGKR